MSRNDAEPPATLAVTATLYPVAREITARPGQSIIVAAGVVIGVYSGDPARRIEGAPALPALPAAQAEPKPAARKPKRAGRKPKRAARKPDPRRAEMRGRFLDAIRGRGGEIRAWELTEAMGGKLFGTPDAYHLRQAVRDLRAEGVIEAGGPGGKGTIYKLLPTAEPAPEPEP
jgi:hypothetical protein